MPESDHHESDVRFPGWYADPDEDLVERFWNGSVWTAHTRSAVLSSDLLGPIDPSLLSLLESFESDHSLEARVSEVFDYDCADKISRV